MRRRRPLNIRNPYDRGFGLAMFAGFGTAAWIGASGRLEDWIIVGGAVVVAFATGWFLGPRPRKNGKDGQGS